MEQSERDSTGSRQDRVRFYNYSNDKRWKLYLLAEQPTASHGSNFQKGVNESQPFYLLLPTFIYTPQNLSCRRDVVLFAQQLFCVNTDVTAVTFPRHRFLNKTSCEASSAPNRSYSSPLFTEIPLTRAETHFGKHACSLQSSIT